MRNPFRGKTTGVAPYVTPWLSEQFSEYRGIVKSFDSDKQFPIVSVLASSNEQARQAITVAVNAKALEMGVKAEYLQVQMLASPQVVAHWGQDIEARQWDVFTTPANHPAIEAPKRKAS